MSKEKIVTTVLGEEVSISQCRKFNKEWYKIGNPEVEDSGQCYLIDGKYYRSETNAIVYNFDLKRYVILNENLIEGVVNLDNDNIKFGYFNRNKNYPFVFLKNGSKFLLHNISLLDNNLEYREKLMDGNYYHIDVLPAKDFNKLFAPKLEYKHSLPYDSKGVINSNLEKYNQNYNPVINENVEQYSKILKGLSFGLEFETVAGFVPEYLLDNHGLIPLRDGSIAGIEYVTVPLEGAKGLQCVVDMLQMLNKRTSYDNKSCSLHLHIGNVPRTKEFITAFFKLTMKIQDEIYTMFPIYKKYNMGIKNKNYSEPLPVYKLLSELDPSIDSSNINKNFNVIYKYLAMGQDFKQVGEDLNNVESHPNDPNGNQKWNIRTRYHIHNLVTLIFGNKKTIEFRVHTPTYDVNKIMAFIMMNSLLINFTIQHQDSILKDSRFLQNLDLLSIINNGLKNTKDIKSDNMFNMFSNYFDYRKSYVQQQLLSGNIVGDESKIPACKSIDWISEKVKDKENHRHNPYIIHDLSSPHYGFDSHTTIKRRSGLMSDPDALDRAQQRYDAQMKELKESLQNTIAPPLNQYEAEYNSKHGVFKQIKDVPAVAYSAKNTLDKLKESDNFEKVIETHSFKTKPEKIKYDQAPLIPYYLNEDISESDIKEILKKNDDGNW